MKKFVYLHAGAEIGIVKDVAHVDERELPHAVELKTKEAREWSLKHAGEAVRVVVSDGHPGIGCQ